MFRYRIADLVVASDIRLPGVPEADGGPADWRLQVGRHRALPRPRSWYHHAFDQDGVAWRSLGRLPGRHVIRFHRAATFTVRLDDRRIFCRACASATIGAIRQLFVAQVVPLLLGGPGRLVLHASAVQTREGTVAFAGATGRGKSTLAAAMAERGCPLVADDCLVVEVTPSQCLARPVDLGVRLRADAARFFQGRAAAPGRTGAKRRFTAPKLGISVGGAANLRRLYLLEPSDGGPVRALPAPGGEAVVGLLASAFQLSTDDEQQMRSMFDLLTTLASRVPVRRLAYPHRFDQLGAVADEVLGGRP